LTYGENHKWIILNNGYFTVVNWKHIEIFVIFWFKNVQIYTTTGIFKEKLKIYKILYKILVAFHDTILFKNNLFMFTNVLYIQKYSEIKLYL